MRTRKDRKTRISIKSMRARWRKPEDFGEQEKEKKEKLEEQENQENKGKQENYENQKDK